MRSALIVALVTFSQLACGGQNHEEAKPKPPAVPQPDDVLAIASVRSLTDAVTGLQAYANAVSPGAGLFISMANATQGIASMLGAESLDGVAVDQSLHIVLLDPKKYPAHPVLLLAHADPARLRAGATVAVVSERGMSLLGDRAAVDLCAAWALGPLAAEQAPAAPTVRVRPNQLVERYRAEIERGVKAMTQAMEQQGQEIGPILATEVDIFLRLARQTRELRASLAVDAAEAALELRLTPLPGSTFEAFDRAQRPATAEMLARVATPRSTMLMAGYYALGPAGDDLFALVGPMFARWVGTTPDAAFRRRWNDVLGHFQGPFAAAMGGEAGRMMGGMRQVLAVDDGPRTVAAMKALFPWTRPTHIDFMQIGMDMVPHQAVATHDGVVIDEAAIKYDFSRMPADQQAQMRAMYPEDIRLLVSGFDRHMAIAMGSDGVEAMKRLIDDVRRGPGGTLSPGAQAAVAAAIRRKASYFLFMDLSSVMQAMKGGSAGGPATSGMTMELGFPDGDAALRFGMPAAHVADLRRSAAP